MAAPLELPVLLKVSMDQPTLIKALQADLDHLVGVLNKLNQDFDSRDTEIANIQQQLDDL